MSPPRLSPRAALTALAAFAALTVFWTWPLAPSLSSRIPHDPGDPLLNTWILWWDAQSVPFTHAWWNPPVFFPMPGALALSEHLAGLTPMTSPVQLAGGTPLAAYNVALLLSFALSGWFAYLLGYRLTGSHVAAACSGMAFGFAPYRAGQLAHLQVVTSQWMPLILLGLHGYVEDSNRKWLVVFGAAWLLQALSNGYYLLFLPVLVACWLAWFVDWRRAPRRGAAILAAWMLASLPLVPVLLEYRSVHSRLGLVRNNAEIVGFSARLSSFLHPAPLLKFWPKRRVETEEDHLFPGVTTVALPFVAALVLAVTRGRQQTRTSVLAFYALATMLMYGLAFGPGDGRTGLDWLRPYRWASLLPGYDGLRVPARFTMLASLCLSVAAGLSAAIILDVLHGRRRAAAGCVALLGLAADGMMNSMPLAHRPPLLGIPPQPANAAIIEIPPDDARVTVAAMYRSMFHRMPLVNGYSGYIPSHYAILALALRRGDTSPLVHLARGRPLIIVVNDRQDSGAGFRDMIRAMPGITDLGSTAAGIVYSLPPQPRLPLVQGTPVPVHVVRDGRVLVLDLGETRIVRGVEFQARWRYDEMGERMAVEASDDGAAWRQIWLDWTGEPVLAGALEDPQRVPVRLTLKDARARYLRVYPAPPWLSRELRVLVP